MTDVEFEFTLQDSQDVGYNFVFLKVCSTKEVRAQILNAICKEFPEREMYDSYWTTIWFSGDKDDSTQRE
jgi:hypothetical protein